MRTNNILSILMLASLALFSSSCNQTPTDPGKSGSSLSGTLIFGIPSASEECYSYSFASSRASLAVDNASDPVWLDENNILFEEPKPNFGGGSMKISMGAANGSTRTALLNFADATSLIFVRPRVSKDKQYLSFSWYPGSFTSPHYNGMGTVICDASGTPIGSLDSLFDGSWAPDGSLIMSGTCHTPFDDRTPWQAGLYKLSADFKQLSVISSALVEPKFPAVSPDGKKVAFVMNKHIWTINMDGSGLKQITTGSKEETIPCWSPDGKNIACASYGTFESTNYQALAVVPSDPAAPTDMLASASIWITDSDANWSSTDKRITVHGTISWR